MFDTAKTHYYNAVAGDGAALKQAAKLLEQLREAFPHDPLILAYSGSTQLLEAAKTLAVWRKGKLSQQGLTVIDDAVKRAPDNLEVRFVRAASTFHLPGFFRRKAESRSDFEWLLPRVPAAVASGHLDRRLGAAALYHHGLFRDEAGDREGAHSAWREAVRIGHDTRAGIDARKKLDGSK